MSITATRNQPVASISKNWQEPRSGGIIWFERIFLLSVFVLTTMTWGAPILGWHLPASVTDNRALLHLFFALSVSLVLIYAAYPLFRSQYVVMPRERMTEFFERHAEWIVGFFVIAYAFMMSSTAIVRHVSFNSHAFDLAIFDQAIWSTTQNMFLFSSLKENICLLGDHMSPILLLFTPFYALWNDARMLIAMQAVITASSMIPLALIAKHVFGHKRSGVFFALLFFLYQPLRHSLRADFHPEIVANPIILWACYFLIRHQTKGLLGALLLVVLCKENMFGISFIVGFYLLARKQFRLGLFLMASSVVLFWFVVHYAIPAIAGSHYLYTGNYSYLLSGDFGGNPPLFVQPMELLEYVWKVFLPLGFLSFFSPLALVLTSPIFFQNVLSRNPFMHSTAFQYTTGLTPFVFFSAILGLKVLLDICKRRKVPHEVRSGIFVVVFLLSLVFSGRPEIQQYGRYAKDLNEHNTIIMSVVRNVPQRFSVVANEKILPHLAHRTQIKQFGDYQRMPASETESSYPIPHDLVILDRSKTDGEFSQEVEKVQRSGFRTVLEYDDFFIFERTDLMEKLNVDKLVQSSLLSEM